jgi:hypothetical protein
LESLELEADNGNKMSALTVFSAVIKYLWELLMNEIIKQVSYVCPEDIKWVITVPAIWTQPAKSFIRKAAIIVSNTVPATIIKDSHSHHSKDSNFHAICGPH